MKKGFWQLSLVLFMTLSLAACGGGGGDDGAPLTAEIEPNNYEAQAQEVTVGVTIAGSANASSDYVDRFKFTPTESRTYTGTLTVDGEDLDLCLSEPSTYYNDCAYYDSDAPFDGPTEVMSYAMTSGITYYFEVWANDPVDGSYTLNIK